jgi:NADPH2:quinone reductase
MKAIQFHRFGGPEVLQLEEVADPIPGPDDVVIAVKAAGVNPADTYMREGTYRIKPALPCIPGGDAAGDVVAVGENVTGLTIGDRVFAGVAMGFDFSGCYAERVMRPASHVLPIPEGVSYAEAVTFGVSYPTAHYALFARGDAKQGETVFIHGASGSVGTAAIQLAKRAGLTVIGSAGSKVGLALVLKEGADHAVDHSQADYLDSVREASGGLGPDLILEMLANVNLAADIEVAAMHGRIVVIGNRGEIAINARIAMMKELDIRGIMLWNVPERQLNDILADILVAAAEGAIKPKVGRQLALADAVEAHELVLQPGNAGKIVLIP